MKPEYSTIREGLRLLREASPAPKVLGSDVHRFRNNPPLPEGEIAAFEARHRIALPADYRGFLAHVGNGGAGPYYGVFPLGEMDDGPWREGGGFVGVLSEPFPHTGPWNDLTGKPEYDEDRADDQEWEDGYNDRLRAWEESYFRTANVNGAIPLCHMGCALRQWLVVTGPEAGRVWSDLRTDHDGLRPTGLTFLQWYETWLDGALRQVRNAGRAEPGAAPDRGGM